MKKAIVVVLLFLCFDPCLLADTEDTVVFRTRMSPANEIPAITLPGASGGATITVRVTRDGRGNINAATVVFEVDFTMPGSTTFVGLHIHNAAPGTNGPVVIGTDLSGSNPVVGTSGRITRTVTYASTDTGPLRFVSGLLAAPELYYVNLHSTVNPGGILRGPLPRNSISFRPAMSPTNEVPAITNLDAEGAALVTIQVNRDAAGTITSGTVIFDVDYRFPGSVTIVGLHLHEGAASVNGPVVISSGLSGTQPITDTDGRGSIFRIAEFDRNNPAGLATLTSLLADPTRYYINLHTTVNPGGVLRSQLERDVLNFMTLMQGGEENPPVATSGSANAMTTVRANRDATGNVTGGNATFNVRFSGFGGPITFVGLHIHSAKIGVNGPVLIGTDLGGGANAVVDDDGVGTIIRQVTIDSSNANALGALKGLFENPEVYYVNLHSTVNPGGVVRSQLTRETYFFRIAMSPANEVPAIPSTATGTGWITVKVNRNADGAITSGTVNFDVNFSTGAAATFTGLHIHRGVFGQNGPVVISSGLGGTATVASDTGTGNITRTAGIPSTDTAGIAALADLINAPDNWYLNLHTTINPGGLMRNQLLRDVDFVAQVAGGGDWVSSVTVTNPFSSASVIGLLKVYDTEGFLMTEAVSDPTIGFIIPPSGSVTFNTHNKGPLIPGSARVHSSVPVNVDVGYSFPGLTSPGRATTVVAGSVSIPVRADTTARDVGIAFLSLESTSATLNLTLRDSAGAPIANGSRQIDLAAGRHLVALGTELLPGVTRAQFTGTLTVQMRKADSSPGRMAVLALQFDSQTLSPVSVSPLP